MHGATPISYQRTSLFDEGLLTFTIDVTGPCGYNWHDSGTVYGIGGFGTAWFNHNFEPDVCEGTYDVTFEISPSPVPEPFTGIFEVSNSIPPEQCFGPPASGGYGSSTHGVNPCRSEAEPVNTYSGSYYTAHTDARLGGIGLPFSFTRSYNSADTTSGPLGPGWSHSYNLYLVIGAGKKSATLHAEDGQQLKFVKVGSVYVPDPGVTDSLVLEGDNTWTLTRKDQVVYRFGTDGKITSLRDRNAQGLTFSYTSGNLTGITDSANRQITLQYTGGLLSKLTLPDGRHADYGYLTGKLHTVTDMRGYTTTYSYDPLLAKLATIQDQNLHTVVQNFYGSDGRVNEQRDALSNTSYFDWDPNTSISTFTDAKGHEWKDYYSGGALVLQSDPLGNQIKQSFDTNFYPLTVTDAKGYKTARTYDGLGNVLTITAPSPLSYVQVFTYYPNNNLETYTDGRAHIWRLEYDSAGNLICVVLPTAPPSVTTCAQAAQENKVVFTRDPAGTGLLTAVTDQRGKTTSIGYNSSGDLTSLTTQLGFDTTFGYDGSGRMTSKVDPRGNEPPNLPADYTWLYTYDEADNLRTVTDPLTNQTVYTWDPANRLTSVEDANHHVTTHEYFDNNWLKKVIPPDPAVLPTIYAYDEVGNLHTRTDANLHVTTYEYDDANRLSTVLSPTGQLWSYTPDANGNIEELVTPLGNSTPGDPNDGKINYSYDELNRLKTIGYSDATPDVTFGYDANSNRASMTDGAGLVTYGYDNLDRMTSETRGSDSFGYEYVDGINLTRRTYPDGTIIDHTYDDDERLDTIVSGGVTVGDYGYDAAANPTSITYPSSNGYAQQRSYDRAGRLKGVRNVRNGVTLSQFQYTLDPVGNPSPVVTSQGTITHQYDLMDRLKKVCYTQACTQANSFISWTYDGVGNRKTETRSQGSTTYSYNDSDQLTQKVGPQGTVNYGYDPNGNQTSAANRTFVYNLENRLTSTTQGSSTITYTFDGDGRRLSASTGSLPSQKVNYSWDVQSSLGLLAMERDGNNALLRRYLYGTGDLLSMYTGGASYYYHPDALGSVANLTKSTGVTEWTYVYEPFGSPRSTTQNDPSAPTNLMRYTGQLFDTGPSLYHLRARQYDPSNGRFLQLDPQAPSLSDAYLSSYLYAENRPTVLTDPSGRAGEEPDGGGPGEDDYKCIGGWLLAALSGEGTGAAGEGLRALLVAGEATTASLVFGVLAGLVGVGAFAFALYLIATNC